jgi:hypothetical protein
MSLKNFEAVAKAYDGLPSDSSISFVDGVGRERIHLGVTRPRVTREYTSDFFAVTDEEHRSELVGIWLVDEPDGTQAYHVVHSDTREQSGLSVNRITLNEAEDTEAGLRLPGAFEHHDIILPHEGAPTIGGLALERMAEIEFESTGR